MRFVQLAGWRSVGVALLMSSACCRPTPPVRETARVEPAGTACPTASASPAIDGTAPAPAAHSAPASGEMEKPVDGMAESFQGDVSPSCWGSSVRLDRIRTCYCQLQRIAVRDGKKMISTRSVCDDRFYGVDLGGLLDVRMVTAAPTVRSGDTLRVDVVLTSRAAVPLAIVFDKLPHQIPDEYATMVKVFDGEGVERTVQGVTSGGNAADGDYLVAIAPGGTAYFPILWRAATVVGAEHPTWVTRYHDLPLPPGDYRIGFSVPFDSSLGLSDAQRMPFATVTVTP
jgi:hypothetical protein